MVQFGDSEIVLLFIAFCGTFGRKLHSVYFAVLTELSVPIVLPRPTVSVRFPSSNTLRPLQKSPILIGNVSQCAYV